MMRVEIPHLFKFHGDLVSDISDTEVYRLYNLRKQIEHWCQANYPVGSYHIMINRFSTSQNNDVEAKIAIDFKNVNDAIHFKLCYLKKSSV